MGRGKRRRQPRELVTDKRSLPTFRTEMRQRSRWRWTKSRARATRYEVGGSIPRPQRRRTWVHLRTAVADRLRRPTEMIGYWSSMTRVRILPHRVPAQPPHHNYFHGASYAESAGFRVDAAIIVQAPP